MVTKTKPKKSVMKKVSIPKGTDRTLVVNGTPVAFFSHEDISGGKKTVDRSKTYKQKPVPGTNRLIDLFTPALPPGWRISERTGKPYFENRENRSDTAEEIAAFVPKPKKPKAAAKPKKKTTAKKPAAPKKKPTAKPKTASPKKKAAPKKAKPRRKGQASLF